MVGRRYQQGPATGRKFQYGTGNRFSAGFLASRVMRGGGYGLIGDIVVGLIGALIGGFLAGLLGLGSYGLLGTIIVAFIGACILIAILHAVSGRRRIL